MPSALHTSWSRRPSKHGKQPAANNDTSQQQIWPHAKFSETNWRKKLFADFLIQYHMNTDLEVTDRQLENLI